MNEPEIVTIALAAAALVASALIWWWPRAFLPFIVGCGVLGTLGQALAEPDNWYWHIRPLIDFSIVALAIFLLYWLIDVRRRRRR